MTRERNRLRIMIALMVAIFATRSDAFVRDTHYDLTFATALSACFDWDEAHLIASANFMVDQNKTTKAESNPLRRKSKVDWHAFTHSGQRYHELWDRVLAEQDADLQLVKFGQFLHFLQDWESHAGFGSSLGHAKATVTGNDPDSMAKKMSRTYAAAQSTAEHMGLLCSQLDRLATTVDDFDVVLIDYFGDLVENHVLDDLIDTSNPRWRKGRVGGLNRLGKRILAVNRERVEVFIEDYLKSNPKNGIPGDFAAGQPDALPRSLELRYDREGNLLNDLGAARRQYQEGEQSGVGGGDDRVQLLETRPVDGGWRVRVRVENVGDATVPQGSLSFVVSDLESGETLGSADRQLPALPPGERIEIEERIAVTRGGEHVMVSVVLDVSDLSALNNFAWYTTRDELRELAEEYREQLEAASREEPEVELGFATPPKVWITSFGWMCITAVVRTDHEDPTHVLDPPEIAIVDTSGATTAFPAILQRFWSITPKPRSVPPAVKTYECVPPLEFCPRMPDQGPLPALRFSVEAGTGENEASVPLGGDLGDDIRRTCEATRREGYVQAADPVGEEPVGLRVLTLNVWHGLRSGESKSKFPGEDEERKGRRFAWQIRLIQELDPDILFFQEVNPNQREARTYAQALGYDEIHKVTSCGFHLPPIKIPKNVNEGLAILARPGLGLRRVQTKRLSGNAACTATFGFQTKESRYALLGEITVEGKKILLATTHLSSPPYVPPGFEEDLKGLLADEVLSEEQYGEIMDRIERKRARNLDETRKLLDQIQKYRERLSDDGWPLPVILGGDFNTEPGTASIEAVEDFGLRNVATGPDYLTWDPVRNHDNYSIGSRRGWPVPTFDLEEVETLLEPRRTTARQIDFLFASEEGEVVSSKLAMDQDRNGMFPSDHFAIFAIIDIDLDPPELDLSKKADADQARPTAESRYGTSGAVCERKEKGHGTM